SFTVRFHPARCARECGSRAARDQQMPEFPGKERQPRAVAKHALREHIARRIEAERAALSRRTRRAGAWSRRPDCANPEKKGICAPPERKKMLANARACAIFRADSHCAAAPRSQSLHSRRSAKWRKKVAHR